MNHQCYYCDQMFESKERLFDHVEIHSDVSMSLENEKGKELKKKLKKTLKKDRTHIKKISHDE